MKALCTFASVSIQRKQQATSDKHDPQPAQLLKSSLHHCFMSRPSQGSSGPPPASIPRMILSPLLRILRRFSIPLNIPTSPTNLYTPFALALTAAIQRLDLSTDPRRTLVKLSKHQFTLSNSLPLAFMAICAIYSLWNITFPPFPLKLGIPLVYIGGLLIPLTSQFVLPATPVFAWLITFFSARFIPSSHRPKIHVNLLPALESVLYGANISDLQTRYTNPFLDVLAWLPYGVLHFALPFLVALLLWMFGPKGSIQYWGRAFGSMNLIGVVTQIFLPCAAPCESFFDHSLHVVVLPVLHPVVLPCFSLLILTPGYEIIHGLTPATYDMPGSPGGLMRIDRVFHSSGYTNAFGAAPLVFGAFPSLHSGCAVMEALFMAHFFPQFKFLYWGYAGVLWWATMYLSHHYLIDLTGGACLSVLVFYLTMPAEFKDSDLIVGRDEYEMVDGTSREEREMELELDLDEEIRKLEETGEAGDEEETVHGHDAEGSAIGGELAKEDGDRDPQTPTPKSKQKRSVSWGETKVLGES